MIWGHRSGIEHRLHWVKDVVQQEDASLIHAPQLAKLMALPNLGSPPSAKPGTSPSPKPYACFAMTAQH
ncbi:MAG: hypothetical protein ACFB0G_19550 [Leptolyngbyaceae cyanobacterium]